jgi:hypothetical protein
MIGTTRPIPDLDLDDDIVRLRQHVKHVEGAGQQAEIDYLEYLFSKNYLKPGDYSTSIFPDSFGIFFIKFCLVLQDREAATNTSRVRQWCLKRNITLINFVALLGHLFDPCDNAIISIIKRYYWNYADRHFQFRRRPTLEETVAAIVSALAAVDSSSIRTYFVRCGWANTTADPEKVVDRLLSEGMNLNHKFISIHCAQLEAYLRDRLRRNKPLPDLSDDNSSTGPLWDVFERVKSSIN